MEPPRKTGNWLNDSFPKRGWILVGAKDLLADNDEDKEFPLCEMCEFQRPTYIYIVKCKWDMQKQMKVGDCCVNYLTNHVIMPEASEEELNSLRSRELEADSFINDDNSWNRHKDHEIRILVTPDGRKHQFSVYPRQNWFSASVVSTEMHKTEFVKDENNRDIYGSTPKEVRRKIFELYWPQKHSETF